MGKLIIFSAPSGSGKTTIVRRLMQEVEGLEFSVSATSRAPRGAEQHGKDYYFLSGEEFDKLISEDSFVEWEEVYAGTKYGTLRNELERIWAKGNTILFDVDVKGGVRLKSIFGDDALSNFHAHIAGIEYSIKGEKKHLNLEESGFNYKDLLKAFKDFNIKGAIVCESPNIEDDAKLLKDYYLSL